MSFINKALIRENLLFLILLLIKVQVNAAKRLLFAIKTKIFYQTKKFLIMKFVCNPYSTLSYSK